LAFDVVTIPPLRARIGDVALLAEHFARMMSRELGNDGFAGFTARAQAALAAHPFPGDVRELRNVVERAVDDIPLDAFASPFRPPAEAAPPADAPPAPGPGDFPSRIRAYEAALLREALAACRFNQRRAAKALGLTYDQLRHYLKKHGIAARP